MSLVEFLQYGSTGPGINAVVGFVLSFLAEWFPGYEGLSPKSKRLIMMGLCLIVPLVSLAGLVVFADQPLTVDAVWLAMVAAFSAFFGSQVAHTRKLSDRVPVDLDYLQGVADDVIAVASDLIQREERRRAMMAEEYEKLFDNEKV